MNQGDGKPWIRRRRPRRILILLSVLLLLALLLVILSVTVFRTRGATTTVNSVKLGGLNTGFSVPTLSVDINVTLDLDITAHNPNHARFRYGAGSAQLFYRGYQVGEATIPPGEIGSGGSNRMNVSLTIFAGKLVADSAIYSDAASGSILFHTTTRISGRVTVLGIFKHHVVTYSSCDVIVHVSNRTVENSNCSYKAKL